MLNNKKKSDPHPCFTVMLLQFNESDGVNCTINTEFFKMKAGIYIMKTLCCWGGNGRWGNKKKKRRVRKKYLKRERKGEENYMGKRGGKLHGKKGEHGLENASFWVINLKNFRFAPPAANLFVGIT